MPLVLDNTETVSVSVTHYVIKDFSMDPDNKVITVRYHKGAVDSNGSFVPSSSNTLSISGSNYNAVIKNAEDINDNEGLGVYASVKKALYQYIADYEGVSGTVE